MPALTAADRKTLLTLARSTVAAELKRGQALKRPTPLSPALAEARGCFVTLHQKGALRGCIGIIEATTPLFDNVAENATHAAFRDPRFAALKAHELDQVEFEVSVLTPPRPLAYKDAADLKRLLQPGVHGVILSRGGCRATFLPQVWEQLPQVETFLSHLCRKAGLPGDCWKAGDTAISVYEAEYFSE